MSTMASVVSSVCIMITTIALAYLLFRSLGLALQHAYRTQMLHNDNQREIAALRHEQAKENAAITAASKKAEAERRADVNAQAVEIMASVVIDLLCRAKKNRDIEP